MRDTGNCWYFHLYHHAVLLELQAICIVHEFIHVFLWASFVLQKFPIISHRLFICNIGFDNLLLYQDGVFFHKMWILWNWFSERVHHSKFSTLLSVLIQFLWFTCGLFSGLSIKAIQTNLWTFLLYILFFEQTCHYRCNCPPIASVMAGEPPL